MIAADIGVPIAALILAAATLLLSGIGLHRKASAALVRSLREQVDSHEKRLTACETARDTLMRENLVLQRIALGLKNGGSK